MGDCSNMYGCRPDGEPELSRISEIFAKNISCLKVASGR
jgi:hypothetical protein